MNIVVIGAGNLGRRHFQSLLSVKGNVNIYVYDPSEEALGLAKALITEQTHPVEFVTDFNKMPKEIFLAVIATSSMHRKEAVAQLLKQAKLKYLVLEKFLFTKMADFDTVQKWLDDAGVTCWVNCPRRMFPFYMELKKYIKGPVNLTVSGSNWGLACNSIHFLDLQSFLTGNDHVTYEADMNGVKNQLFSSKRAGYTEFMGDLKLEGSDGSKISISCSEEGNIPVTVSLESPTHKLFIYEGGGGKALWASQDNNWKWQVDEFSAPFQSQLSSKFAEQIIATGTCDLTTYAASAALHKVLLESWINKSRAILATEAIDECIIT